MRGRKEEDNKGSKAEKINKLNNEKKVGNKEEKMEGKLRKMEIE